MTSAESPAGGTDALGSGAARGTTGGQCSDGWSARRSTCVCLGVYSFELDSALAAAHHVRHDEAVTLRCHCCSAALDTAQSFRSRRPAATTQPLLTPPPAHPPAPALPSLYVTACPWIRCAECLGTFGVRAKTNLHNSSMNVSVLPRTPPAPPGPHRSGKIRRRQTRPPSHPAAASIL